MSIILSLFLGCVFGWIFSAMWRIEELQALQKANARLVDELAEADNVFKARKRQSWVK